MGLNMWQILLVLLVFVLLFGRGRIPALMGDLAAGIKSFKQGIQDEESASAKVIEKQKNTPTAQTAEAPAQSSVNTREH